MGCGIANQGIFRLQVEDVELVDARRDHQERLFIDLFGQRLVFEQLKVLVLEHHGAFGGGDVFTDLEDAFVGHRHMALLHVMKHVCQALGNALAPGFDGFFLRLGIERQKVAGR